MAKFADPVFQTYRQGKRAGENQDYYQTSCLVNTKIDDIKSAYSLPPSRDYMN